MDQIAQLISEFKKSRWKSNPFDAAQQIALESPERVHDLINAIVDELPEGGTFHDMAMSFLPIDEWPAVVRHALAALERQPKNDAAAAVVAYASLQAVESLHPHLTTIFRLAPNAIRYYEHYPWRDSGRSNFEFLKSIFEQGDDDDIRRAWWCLLETRHPDVLDFAVMNVRKVDLNHERREYALPETIQLNDNLAEVGFEQNGDQRRCLYLDQPWHIVLPGEYYPNQHPVLPTQIGQPTWTANGPILGKARTGGPGTTTCGRCSGRRHHLITLDAALASLQITTLRQLSIETCLSCLGWEVPRMFYRHSAEGFVTCLAATDAKPPQFPATPLREEQAVLVGHGPRWRWQDWALSNSRENLNRIGGHPTWVQSAEYPGCPECGTAMRFLLQLDSNFQMAEGGEWMWGSGGMAYIFWCDACHISGLLWQCT